MAATDLYEVIVVLPPQIAGRVLTGLNATVGISRFPSRVAVGDRAESLPVWAAQTDLVDPTDLIGELRPRLPAEAISYLRQAAMIGYGLAHLRFVPETALATISASFPRSWANVVSEPTDLRGRSGTTRRSSWPRAIAW